jgi:hypothetical protein
VFQFSVTARAGLPRAICSCSSASVIRRAFTDRVVAVEANARIRVIVNRRASPRQPGSILLQGLFAEHSGDSYIAHSGLIGQGQIEAKWAQQEVRKIIDSTQGMCGDLQAVTGRSLPTTAPSNYRR